MRKWEAVRDAVAKKIDELEALAFKNAKWKDEIVGRANQLEEGWSIVERDPQEEEIRKEIEYYGTVLAEADDDAITVDNTVDVIEA